MYEHVRTALQGTLQGRQRDQAAAHQATLAAQAAITSAQQGLAAANNALSSALQSATTAQNTLGGARSDQQAKQAALASAQAAVTAWMAQEPDPFLDFLRPTLGPIGGGGGGGGQRPNPAHARWLLQLHVLQSAVTAAQNALNAAAASLASATSAVAAANAQVNARRADVVAWTQDLARAQAAAATAAAAENAAGTAVQAVRDQLGALDARAARLLAQPLDRPGLTAMSDEEQAEVSRLRAQRATTRADRFAVSGWRGGILAAHDATIDSLPPISAALHTWNDPAYPDPPGVATQLDALVATARQQRGATTRTDDLADLTAELQRVVGRLQTTVGVATSDRDAKYASLQQAIATVKQVNADAP